MKTGSGGATSNIIVDGQHYDFCHHCKQLKNTFLLVSCKYSSRAHGAVKNLGSQGSTGQAGSGAGANSSYVMYPYEPQCYAVNGVKIFNADLQNRSQLRGIMEGTKRALRHKNSLVKTAQTIIRSQMLTEEGNQASISFNESPFSDLSDGDARDFDMQLFKKNNKQLYQ